MFVNVIVGWSDKEAKEGRCPSQQPLRKDPLCHAAPPEGAWWLKLSLKKIFSQSDPHLHEDRKARITLPRGHTRINPQTVVEIAQIAQDLTRGSFSWDKDVFFFVLFFWWGQKQQQGNKHSVNIMFFSCVHVGVHACTNQHCVVGQMTDEAEAEGEEGDGWGGGEREKGIHR